MYNRVQQRFDKSIREAVEETKRVKASTPPRQGYISPAEEPKRAKGKHVLLMDPETGGTVLVPYNHPLAVAKRQQRRASANVSSS